MVVVYAIKSEKTGRIYVGHTSDLKQRINRHNSGYVKSTKSGKPWRVVAIEKFEDRSKARWKERKLKESRGVKMDS